MTDSEMSDGSVLEQAAEWIVMLNDATATEQDFMAWQAWLAEDAAHARAFQELHETWRRSAALSTASARSLYDLGKIRSGAASPRDETHRSRRRSITRWAAAAALAFSLVGAGFFAWRGNANTIQTTTAEMRSVLLPDGSRAALGPETSVRVSFSEHHRSLKMQTGEAFFEVARAPGRPFSVETPAGRVIAIGTAFSVNLSGQRMAVTVTEGSVRVEPIASAGMAADSHTASLIVAAGHKLVHDGASTKARTLAPSADAMAWQEGRLQYEGEPLRVVVSDINRYSPRKLRIADAAVGELRYTGTVFPDALDVWLSSIEGVFPLHVTEKGGEQLIVSADR